MTTPWLGPDEVELRLLLPIPPTLDAASWAQLEAATLASRPAALLVDPTSLSPATQLDTIARLTDLAREAGTAVLIRGDAPLVIDTGADGVELEGPALIEPVRRLIGPERLIGCRCGTSRHDAMLAGEAGADYVLFAAALSATRVSPEAEMEEPGQPADASPLTLLRWWTELFVLPAAIEVSGDLVELEGAIAAGADFVVPQAGLWTMPQPLLDFLGRVGRGRRSSPA